MRVSKSYFLVFQLFSVIRCMFLDVNLTKCNLKSFSIANYNGIGLSLLIPNIQINILLIINITYETHIHNHTCL